MDDYLIGIRLALDNGVSAGLASIRADLSALDAAIAASAEGLRALTETSTHVPLPIQSPPPRPVTQPTADLSATAPAVAPGALTPGQGSTSATAPVVRIDPPPTAPIAPLQAAPPAHAINTTTTRSDISLAPVLSNTPTNAPTAPANRFTAAQPSAAQTSTPWPGTPLAPAQAVDAAPNAPELSSTNAPTGGDVYLDGERLGHWVSNHLAREANRPSYGGTGFDPSLSIAWPGAAQGGQ